METCTNKAVNRSIHSLIQINTESTIGLYVKKNKNVCWLCNAKSVGLQGKNDTRDGTVLEECGFHCHAEKILNVGATVLGIAYKSNTSEPVAFNNASDYRANALTD